MELPKLVFKYRTISTLKDVVRFTDIVQKNKIYLPTVLQLNDPFEGQVNISFATAGSAITREMDIDYGPVTNAKEKTRVLSLSEDCFSPQLWAYYCNNYHGVCLCFSTSKSFKAIEPVKYPDHINQESIHEATQSEFYKLIKESLLRKQSGWKYEKEWRMIFQPEVDDNEDEVKETPSSLSFYSDELLGVIVGNKLTKDEQELIRALTPSNIKMFTVHTGALSGKVKLTNYGYVYPGDGSQPDYITNVIDLYNRINP